MINFAHYSAGNEETAESSGKSDKMDGTRPNRPDELNTGRQLPFLQDIPNVEPTPEGSALAKWAILGFIAVCSLLYLTRWVGWIR